MKSASNRDILNDRLQVLYVHVLLVAPLGASHMAQPGTEQNESGVAIRETAHHTGTATDLPVQPLNDIVGADVSPVFTGKIAVGKGLLNVDICFLVQLTDGEGRDLAPHRASVMSSTRRTDVPARYISMRASSTLLSRRR